MSKFSELKPIYVWENLHLFGVKDLIYPSIKLVAGIYLIVNLVNGKMYVGSAMTGRMQVRFHRHLFAGSGSKPLWNAIQKHGLENFAFLVVAEIPGFSPDMNQQLLDLETLFISAYGYYNIAPEAGNTFGVILTDAQRAAMRANYSQERRDAIGALNRGKVFSPHTIALMQASALARPPMSDESRSLVSANSAKALLFELSMLDGTLLSTGVASLVLRTIPVVASYCDCSERTVRRAVKGSGIIKNKWFIKSLGRANNTIS
jgi:group I intron endonuclease